MQREELEQLLGKKMKPGVQNDPRILVDPEDAWLLAWKWSITTVGKNIYVQRRGGPWREYPTLMLARCILGAAAGTQIIYRNDNHLDLRRGNLAAVNHSNKHAHTGIISTNTSGYKGIVWNKERHKWCASIEYQNKRQYLGAFATPEEAAEVYDEKARELFGEHARTNVMLGNYPWQHPEQD